MKQEEDVSTFFFQKKEYTNKRRGKYKDGVYNLVPIQDVSESLDIDEVGPNQPLETHINCSTSSETSNGSVKPDTPQYPPESQDDKELEETDSQEVKLIGGARQE